MSEKLFSCVPVTWNPKCCRPVSQMNWSKTEFITRVLQVSGTGLPSFESSKMLGFDHKFLNNVMPLARKGSKFLSMDNAYSRFCF